MIGRPRHITLRSSGSARGVFTNTEAVASPGGPLDIGTNDAYPRITTSEVDEDDVFTAIGEDGSPHTIHLLHLDP